MAQGLSGRSWLVLRQELLVVSNGWGLVLSPGAETVGFQAFGFATLPFTVPATCNILHYLSRK